MRAFLLQSLVLSQEGNRWSLNLNALAANMEAIVGFPDMAGRFSGPALFLRGGQSPYVLDAHRPLISGLFPAARIDTLPDAGHWLHADRPREFLARVADFLAE